MNKILPISLLIAFIVACTPRYSAPTTTSLPASPSPTSAETIIPTETNTPVILPTVTSTPKPPDQILKSPNGEFVAVFANAYSHPAYEPQVIQIFDKNSSLLWEIPYQHETAMVDPHPSLAIYGWSKDSAYLYFYYSFSPDGGDRAFWWDGFDLQRIKAQTGEIEQVISGDKESFVAFAFSLDETQIAYTRQQDNPSIFYIHNLVTGTDKTTNVIISAHNYIRVGSIVWSPSGNKIAFQTESDDYVAQTIFLDPSNMKQKVVREYLVDTSYFDGWNDDNNLRFLDIRGSKGYIVNLNIINGKLVEIGTPTPQP